MKPFTVRDLLDAVHGELLSGSPEAVVSAVCTDSRAIEDGALFIAIVGEKNDGHDYLDAALDKGAAACLLMRAPQTLREGRAYIRVPDTVVAYKDLAAWYRAQFSIPVVQVTGSVGKTTTKEMLASVLAQHFETLKTEKNYNNEIGTPMTLLRLEKKHEAAVVETGMDRAGQIRYLGEMVKPTVAVITNVGDMHIEFLGSRENILRAKCEIFENLAPDGVAVLNGDDVLLNTVSLPQRIVRFGTAESCDVRVTEVNDRGIDGISCVVTTARGRYALDIPAPGAHMVYPAATAVAVGETLGLTAEEIVRGVAAYEPEGSRMHVVELCGGRRLLDDCYNAGPQSMRAALEVLSRSEGNTLAVLGDMAELGDISESAHREIGALARELGIGGVIAVGERARRIAESAGGKWFATVDEALDEIKRAFAPGMAMLVKASHSMHFERITEELTEEFPQKEP
ncbi:MAG: UDP-N-acetylmuramoyl-tripeptide--D-alanyl-D-alanine ligase [Ruminococcaceae bacterium]|nr:UDP-N-acetylmuramoyl-tripeptide--D-alanyl-D-alanine ligase [Oscillospiraceae bacterium]